MPVKFKILPILLFIAGIVIGIASLTNGETGVAIVAFIISAAAIFIGLYWRDGFRKQNSNM